MKKHYTREKVLSIREGIIKATEKQFKKYGYANINFLTISKSTKLSRPSFYNYYHSKEEIFLDILLREYRSFAKQLQKELGKEKVSKDEFAAKLTAIVLDNLYLAELVSSYGNLIEENSTVERLKEYRLDWQEGFYKPFMEVLALQFPNADETTKDSFLELFVALLHGSYPIICPAVNKVEALSALNEYKPEDQERFIRRVLDLLMTNID